jgi:hypothetical protein
MLSWVYLTYEEKNYSTDGTFHFRGEIRYEIILFSARGNHSNDGFQLRQ